MGCVNIMHHKEARLTPRLFQQGTTRWTSINNLNARRKRRKEKEKEKTGKRAKVKGMT